MTARVHVAAEGVVEGVKLVTDTLVAHPSNGDCGAVRQAILSVIVRSLQDAAFPAAAADSHITVPFVFQVQVCTDQLRLTFTLHWRAGSSNVGAYAEHTCCTCNTQTPLCMD